MQTYRGTVKYVYVVLELVHAARYRGLTTYQQVATIMGLPTTGNYMGQQVGIILGEISEDEVAAGRPMLSAIAVKASGEVGPGFYVLARELARPGADGDEQAFREAESQRVYDAWRYPPE